MGWLGQGNIVPKANVGSVKAVGGKKVASLARPP